MAGKEFRFISNPKVGPFSAPEQIQEASARLNTNAAGKIMSQKMAAAQAAREEETGVKVIRKPSGTQADHHVTTGRNYTKGAGMGGAANVQFGEQIK